MKITIALADSTLELIDDHNYTPFSADNPVRYGKAFISEAILKKEEQMVSKAGIFIRDKFDNDNIMNSAIICETGGATSMSSKSFMVKNNDLILCICNMIYSLDLTSLNLNWKTRVDQVTCFTIHEFAEGMITHGELQLTYLNFDGVIQWAFSARDIFVTSDNKHEFRIESGLVIVRDWLGYEYSVNSKGELMREIKT